MPRALRCPVCRVELPAGGTHCPRCGLRVAALPRRPRGEGGAGARPPRLASSRRIAALQGAGLGSILVLVAALAGAATSLAGGPGRAIAGDLLLVVAGLLVLAAVLMPGVHLTRWAEREVMQERAAAAHSVDPRRAFALVAAGLCAVALLGLAAWPS